MRLGDYVPTMLCRRSLTIRRPLGEGEMGTCIIIIAHVCVDDSLELILTDRDDVVSAFAPEGPNDALAVAILPWGASGADDLLKLERVDASLKLVAEDSVLVTMDEPSVRLPGQGLGELLRRPFGCRVRRDRDVQDTSAPMIENDEYIEQ